MYKKKEKRRLTPCCETNEIRDWTRIQSLQNKNDYKMQIRLQGIVNHFFPFFFITLKRQFGTRTPPVLVLFGGAGTTWVMGGVIDDGVAHNHPLLYGLLLISICLLHYPSALGERSEFAGANCAQQKFRAPWNTLPKFRRRCMDVWL